MTSRTRFTLLAVAWVGAAVIGTIGWTQYPHDAPWSVGELIYRDISLFTLNFPVDSSVPTPFLLDLARLLAPIVAASTLVQAAALLFRRQFDRARVARARDHVVVCGLGEKGWRLAAAAADHGVKVAGVDLDDSSPGAEAARRHGVAVVSGDASDASVLRAVGVHRASHIVVTCGDDGASIDVAAAVGRLASPTARCSVHLTDARLCELLHTESIRQTEGPRLELFNVFTAGARQWLAAHPAIPHVPAPAPEPAAGEESLTAHGDAPVPADYEEAGAIPLVMVVGLGEMGQALAVAAVQQATMAEGKNRLRLALVDPDAETGARALVFRGPTLLTRAELEPVDFDFVAPQRASVERVVALLEDPALQSVHVCIDDDASAVSFALRVRQTLRGRELPVVVRTSSDAGVASVLRRSDGAPAFEGLFGFSVLDRTCTSEMLDGGPLEALARALHEDYRGRAAATGGAYAVGWDELPEEARESSRKAAEAVFGGLRQIGCDLVPAGDWDEGAFALDGDEVDALAAREHGRWKAEREGAGWSYAENRDDDAKTNPLLVAWEELPEEARESNRDAARATTALLARAGFQVVRLH